MHGCSPSSHCLEALLGNAAVPEVSPKHGHLPPQHRHSLRRLSLSLRLLSPLLVHGIHPLRLMWSHVSKSVWNSLPMNAACCLLLLQVWAALFPMSSIAVSARRRGWALHVECHALL